MSLEALFNADVTLVPAIFGRGLHWWLDQLYELLPSAVRKRNFKGPMLLWEGGALQLVGRNRGSDRMPPKGARVSLALPERLAFVRTLELPPMSSADLRRTVDLEIERLSPLPRTESISAVDAEEARQGSSAKVEVAILPRFVAQEALQAVEESGLRVAKFALASGGGRSARFDFVPALREAGLLSPERSPAIIWWALVGFAFILNVAVLIARDEQSVNRLSAIVQQQEPAVAAARAMETKAARFEAAARDLRSERSGHDIFGVLAIVSEDLPASAWVQRFTYNGRTARLVGYRQKDVDVIAALRKDPRIAAVQSNTSQLVADTPAGQPFDVTIALGRSQ